MPIAANETWKCPHCWISNRFEKVSVYGSWDREVFSLNIKNDWEDLTLCRCTNCWDIILQLDGNMIYPLWSIRWNAPREVPAEIAQDFNEACLVEPLSSKAAAALARRCLQNMLHEQGIKGKDLSSEIDQAMKTLPSHLSQSIDAIRNIGNFSAHPIKFQNTWDIVDVEEWETERILDTLENLFDFYYVQPAITANKKAALNAKLQAAWKPAMK